MQQQLNLVMLGVGDLDASRRFYTDGLGWSPEFESHFRDAVIVYVTVSPWLALPGPVFEIERFTFGWTVVCHEAVARVRAAGGDVLKEPVVGAFGGYHAYIADPDGYLWEIATNPGFSVDDDGNTHIGSFDPEEA